MSDTAAENKTAKAPATVPRSYFKKSLVKRLDGRHALICYLYLKSDGSFDRQGLWHGVVTAVDAIKGVTVTEDGSGEIITLPPDLRPWHKAKKKTYELEPGKSVDGIDMVSSWIVLADSNQLLPYGKQFRRPKSGSYNVYGIGTKLYGHAGRHSDGSYVATKWLTLFFLPIFPLGSYRIFRNRPATITFGWGLSGEHRSQPVFLNIKQVVVTYLIGLILLVTFVLVFFRN